MFTLFFRGGRRIFSNSLKDYIESIKKDKNADKYAKPLDKTKIEITATRLDKFEDDYTQFCEENSMYPKNIRKETSLLEYYNLELINITRK
jgi:hypothetical protein